MTSEPSLRLDRVFSNSGAIRSNAAAKLLACGLMLQITAPSLSEEAAKVSMFPSQAIAADDNYGDWYGPELEQLGEKPLWTQGAVQDGGESLRFLFIRGVGMTKGPNSVSIRIDMGKTGEGNLVARQLYRDHGRRTVRQLRRTTVSPEEFRKVHVRAEEAQLSKFEVGEWEDGEGIPIHCTELIMERVAEGHYAVSHVLISCNQPIRLMPLIEDVRRLAGLRQQVLFYQLYEDESK